MEHYEATPEGMAQSAADARALSTDSNIPVYVYVAYFPHCVKLCRVLPEAIERRGGYFRYAHGEGEWKPRMGQPMRPEVADAVQNIIDLSATLTELETAMKQGAQGLGLHITLGATVAD